MSEISSKTVIGFIGLAAASPADLAARAEVICLCVPDTPDVESVLFGANGVASTVKAGSVVIDFSTISSQATVGFAERLKEAGVAMLDSPVSGGPGGARVGHDALEPVRLPCLSRQQCAGRRRRPAMAVHGVLLRH